MDHPREWLVDLHALQPGNRGIVTDVQESVRDVREEAILAVAALLREWTTEHEEGEADWRHQAEETVIAIECGDLP